MNFFKPHLFSRLDLLKLVPKRGWVLEVGVFESKFTREMAVKRPDLHIMGVDNWDGIFANNKAMAYQHLGNKGMLIQANSVEFARSLGDGTLDMVYIDGDHAYKAAKADIEAYWPKVRKGGILAGHDYEEIKHDRPIWGTVGVEPAVDEFVKANGLTLNVISSEYPQSFYIKKP